MNYQTIKNDPEIRCYIKAADASLISLGFTEHSFQHVTVVAEKAGRILEALSFPPRTAELARIAGFLHDIGNLVNRIEHSQSSAVMAMSLLQKRGFPPEEIAPTVAAIGNHDEGTGTPVNEIAAALILADKSDVRRTRVRNSDPASFDIHDRVNFSVTRSRLEICPEEGIARLNLSIDTKVSSVLEFFEIFMDRMCLCRNAAQKLGLTFKLVINDQILL